MSIRIVKIGRWVETLLNKPFFALLGVLRPLKIDFSGSGRQSSESGRVPE
jgi:hypothetical protein